MRGGSAGLRTIAVFEASKGGIVLVAAAGLVSLILYELFRRVTVVRISLLVVNSVIVLYLARALWRARVSRVEYRS